MSFLLPHDFNYSVDNFCTSKNYTFCVNETLSLAGGFVLSRNAGNNNSFFADELPLSLSVRFRQGGERAHPQGRQHSQVLKKLLQEYKLEPWLRDIVPLIYDDDNLIAVGNLWVESGSILPADFFVWTYSG